MNTAASLAALVLLIIADGWYCFQINRGAIAPALATWLIFGVATTISLVSYLRHPRKNSSFIANLGNRVDPVIVWVMRVWDEKQEKWYFSVVDIIGVLTDQLEYQAARKYWKVLKGRLNQEGSQLVTNCYQLKMVADDGKQRETDVADVETILRLIQSIPSPKAEPFKLWLAKVGYERMQETIDPERAVSRARKNWQSFGRSKKWIEQRMLSVETRNKLTDYWADHGIEKKDEFAKLTNIIHEEWSGLSVKEHKNLKKLQEHNLRDHMSEAELIFTALAELSTREIADA